jgi:fructose-bisphosphate aldolase class II
MALTTLRQLLDHAAECGYGMPAFNVTNLETLQGVMQAAQASRSPVIVQASQSARRYCDDTFIQHLFAAAVERYPEIPVCVHQDHGSSLATCTAAMDLGFSSIMMDGSLEADQKTPASFDYNVSVTRSTVRAAHARGVSVEGEIGVLGSLETGSGEKEDGHGFEGTLDKSMLLTDPELAAQFVEATEVDALAVALGTSHGAYKFSRRPTGDILAMDVIEAIHARLPNTHLVMHGASTIPEDLQALINDNGGEIPVTFGVPLEEVERGIRSGVRKVNIDTDLRMAMIGSLREYLRMNPGSFDIRAAMKPGVARIKALCIQRFERFGAAGQAERIKPISLLDMKRRYADGKLGAL